MLKRITISILTLTLVLSLGVLSASAQVSSAADGLVAGKGGGGLPNPLTPALGGTGVAAGSTYEYPCSINGGGGGSATANTYVAFGFWVHSLVTFSNIVTAITTGDNSANKYDFGIYNSAGTLLADIGAQSITTSGLKDFAIIQNASCTGSGTPSTCCTGSGTGTCPVNVTLTSGVYFFAETGNANTLSVTVTIPGTNMNPYLYGKAVNAGSTSGGILSATITPPSTAPVANTGFLSLALAQS